MLMDTTRLDVFGFDPVTLRWVQAELTVAMDWYTHNPWASGRCLGREFRVEALSELLPLHRIGSA
jgi:hypothetical protein